MLPQALLWKDPNLSEQWAGAARQQLGPRAAFLSLQTPSDAAQIPETSNFSQAVGERRKLSSISLWPEARGEHLPVLSGCSALCLGFVVSSRTLLRRAVDPKCCFMWEDA